ncbi:Os01g0551900, partial [Oryza sativa Japonica Group]
AICLNSINEQQGAIATNRKGLVFFNWNDKQDNKNLAEYIWAGSDWPLDGWAGCESTPTSTSFSPSVGLGRRKGSHLSSGGPTISLGSLAKPGRDLTGGGAFGIPGYAGIGASGFGWGEPDEFEDFVDPPATLENIHSRALSRHPSLPLLLVGSSNTHVYLWEFGKDSAMATYGVLPAANIPPPYALASISAVQFDYYGQRFATAALDGTVCTWQVEVGGRSNVHPTESSLCFNTHASDVAFLTASGSVLAAAGCSSNGANVVIWDTLAPPSTCQTSIMCHEGGVRSLSVFDRNIGCGSISPLIVTGGKSGDVTLHDFRFISTGKTKHHRSSNEHDVKASSTSMHDTKSGTSNGVSNSGMIWHIPKAHTGSVSSVSTIPNTSLFLTGSKDGDVKLWDAKSSQLVFHWQKLHERHTFFQPTSRGFGGVVRAAVTDIQVLPNGFVSCGGDGSVKLVQVKNDFADVRPH